MSVPDKLVEAAAAAMIREANKRGVIPDRQTRWAWERDARVALAAAFAALPECEEAVDAIGTALLAAQRKHPYISQTSTEAGKTAAAGLAEMAKP